MELHNYRCTITAPVSAEEAFDGINNVSGWWAKNFEGYSESLHDIFTVRFGKTYVTFEITELIPNQLVAWLVTDCNLHWIENKREWTGTSILWEITGAGDSARIDMTHIGLVPDVECFEDCEAGWNDHIKNSLSKYLTEKVGAPT